MRAVAYVSSAKRELSAEDLDAIVAEARRLNEASGVTGMLLYCDGNFMQYFEGEDDAVAQTLARVRASGRHHHVSELMNEAISHREFAQWSMGFARAMPDAFLDPAAASWESEDAHGPGAALLKTFWAGCRCRNN